MENNNNQKNCGAEAPNNIEIRVGWKTRFKRGAIKAGKVLGLGALGAGLAYGGFRFRGFWDSIGSRIVDDVTPAVLPHAEEVAEAAAEAVETIVEP